MQQIQSILIAKSNPDMTLKALQKGKRGCSFTVTNPDGYYLQELLKQSTPPN